MRISNWKSSYNAMRIDTPDDGSKPSQEGELYLAEQFLIALYTAPKDQNFDRTDYPKDYHSVEKTIWESDAQEGITCVTKHGDVCYYFVGSFQWNGKPYKVKVEIAKDARGRTPKFLQWLNRPSWPYIHWEKGYDPVLPTGKNTNADTISGVTFTENFYKEDYSGMTFEGCTFKDVTFIYTNLAGAVFRNCVFDTVSFVDTNARFTVVEDCTFNSVCLRDSVWTGTIWHNCHFITPLSMKEKEGNFDYEFYEYCNNVGIAFSTGGDPDEYKHCLPGMSKAYIFYRPRKEDDYLLPIHDDRFTYVPIDGAYMLVGDRGLADGSTKPTNQMLWDAYMLSRRAPDNPLGRALERVW